MNLLISVSILIKALYGVIVASFFYGAFSGVKMILNLFSVLGSVLFGKKATAVINSIESKESKEKVIEYVYIADIDVKGEKLENKKVLVSLEPKKDCEYEKGTELKVYWDSFTEEAVVIGYKLRCLGENAAMFAVAVAIIALAFFGITFVSK